MMMASSDKSATASVQEARQRLWISRLVIGSAEGDLLTFYNAFVLWRQHKEQDGIHEARKWAADHYINEGALKRAERKLSALQQTLALLGLPKVRAAFVAAATLFASPS